MNSNIALQIERTTGGSVTAGTPVAFDNIIYTAGDISYAPGSDTVLFNRTGNYLIEWWIASQTTLSSQGAVFEITGSNINPSTATIGNSPIKTGEVSGLAAISVTQTPASLTLVNKSPQEIWFSTIVPVKAVLRIHSHHELENLDDGNALGSLIGIGAAREYTMGNYAVALGIETIASGDYSNSEGYATEATGLAAHTEGINTRASGMGSHGEGEQTDASGDFSHAEGTGTRASGTASHSEGNNTQASGNFSHAEGSFTTASGNSSHAEGDGTIASGSMAHAEGFQTVASEWASHAEGSSTQAEASHSHAEGYYTTASGVSSHAEGEHTSTSLYQGSHIMGRYGEAEMNYSWFLANGTDENNLGLAAKIQTDGNAYIDLAWNAGGADYAEMFETVDGNPIEPGYFITLGKGKKIRIMDGDTDDYVLGISSAAPSVLGNAGEIRWHGKYQTDEWGRIRYQTVTIPADVNQEGKIILPERTEQHPILNPKWDPHIKYIPRTKRQEWVAVGLLGQIAVRDDGSCTPGGYCSPGKGGIAKSTQSGYKVLERMGKNQILILFR